VQAAADQLDRDGPQLLPGRGVLSRQCAGQFLQLFRAWPGSLARGVLLIVREIIGSFPCCLLPLNDGRRRGASLSRPAGAGAVCLPPGAAVAAG
jgi:hypothetical protein